MNRQKREGELRDEIAKDDIQRGLFVAMDTGRTNYLMQTSLLYQLIQNEQPK